MEKINYSIKIKASSETVWNILWGEESYKDQTSVFTEGSTVVTNWEEGSKVLFLDGKGSGMVSKIEKKINNEFMSFEHLGMMKDGIEDTTSEAVKEWSGAHENYTLADSNGGTKLTVEMDTNEEFYNYFKEIWPKALDKN